MNITLPVTTPPEGPKSQDTWVFWQERRGHISHVRQWPGHVTVT